MKKNMKTMVLCAGRHETPATEAIFPQDIASILFDEQAKQDVIHTALSDCTDLRLYVTGATPALISALNYCIYNGVAVTLYHYNRDTGSYEEQTLATEQPPYGC